MRKLLAGIMALVMVLSLSSFASAADGKELITVTVFRGDPGDQPSNDNRIYYVENGRMLMTKEQYDNRADAKWLISNAAKAIWESCPKKQGTMDDGNAWAPGDQGEIYFDLMSDYDKAFLSAYGYKKPADFFNAPIELAPYGEAWQIDKAPIQDEYNDFLRIQDEWLPKIIMSADDAEFEKNWDAFVKEITPSAEVFSEFMQAEVLKLVEQVTK